MLWGSLGLVFGALGGCLGALCLLSGTLGGSSNLQNFFVYPLEPSYWLPRSPQHAQTTPQAPSWRDRWQHEATEAHLQTYFDVFSFDFDAKINEK